MIAALIVYTLDEYVDCKQLVQRLYNVPVQRAATRLAPLSPTARQRGWANGLLRDAASRMVVTRAIVSSKIRFHLPLIMPVIVSDTPEPLHSLKNTCRASEGHEQSVQLDTANGVLGL